MDLKDAISARHSVRAFTDEPLSAAERATLQEAIDQANAEGGLAIALVCDEPQAFDSTLAHYGKFENVRNYLVLAGAPAPDLDERCGFYGEKIVLLAQTLGLNTCWVALTFKKRHVKKMVPAGTELALVVALGHGKTQGNPRKSKAAAQVASVAAGGDAPAWFTAGVEAALLAPTALNQQKFSFELTGQTAPDGRPLVRATAPKGSYTQIDLGIARCHFELAAGAESFAWA